jgi:hypothetical protein
MLNPRHSHLLKIKIVKRGLETDHPDSKETPPAPSFQKRGLGGVQMNLIKETKKEVF